MSKVEIAIYLEGNSLFSFPMCVCAIWMFVVPVCMEKYKNTEISRAHTKCGTNKRTSERLSKRVSERKRPKTGNSKCLNRESTHENMAKCNVIAMLFVGCVSRNDIFFPLPFQHDSRKPTKKDIDDGIKTFCNSIHII